MASRAWAPVDKPWHHTTHHSYEKSTTQDACMLAHDLSGAEIRSHRFRVTHVATALFVAAEQGPLQVQVNPVTLLRSSGGDPTWNDAYSQAGRKLLVIEPFVPVIAVCNLSVGATTHWSTLQLVASRMEEAQANEVSEWRIPARPRSISQSSPSTRNLKATPKCFRNREKDCHDRA
nr:unnamed protein product [Digitaria exilis]